VQAVEFRIEVSDVSLFPTSMTEIFAVVIVEVKGGRVIIVEGAESLVFFPADVSDLREVLPIEQDVIAFEVIFNGPIHPRIRHFKSPLILKN
jgi:hypothetical protein